MSRAHGLHVSCIVCGEQRPAAFCMSVATIRPAFAEFVQQRHPERWSPEGHICRSCLNAERTQYIINQLESERGALSAIEADVSQKAAAHVAIAAHLDRAFERKLSFGQRVADRVASVGGSWPFVIAFGLALAAWITLNSLALRGEAFDPYPYILLNLMLSCLAAVQAPVIMMSQNRAAARDRMEADEDYKVNLKAELEIAALHDKVDHLLHVQWERMVEIQQTQMDLLSELAGRRR